ncbi:NIPSNAP family protein [Actinomycetospora sp. NBRC 106378]|uniref:NIPSNAP family protein n=1 Tax=Actinomycetospora sp. NBRC 106378 TaxID=3032208 RepID=UPI0024A06690|nr:hypothetical protein Acsp07_15870 [Actinomycetospora sp. NBRC 106378]
MTTCVVRCTIGPPEIDVLERFAATWMDLVDRHGGTHHGYYLPGEGASDEALALVGFPSLADDELCRQHVDGGP